MKRPVDIFCLSTISVDFVRSAPLLLLSILNYWNLFLLLQITCFDPAVAKDVTKAIQLALSLNPQIEEGGNVRVPLPRVSMEVREQTAKALNKKAESCRQRLRKVRRKAMDRVKKGKDGKLAGISKDDAFATGKEVETVITTR